MVKELELKLKREHSQCLKFTKVIFDFDLLSELENGHIKMLGGEPLLAVTKFLKCKND